MKDFVVLSMFACMALFSCVSAYSSEVNWLDHVKEITSEINCDRPYRDNRQVFSDLARFIRANEKHDTVTMDIDVDQRQHASCELLLLAADRIIDCKSDDVTKGEHIGGWHRSVGSGGSTA